MVGREFVSRDVRTQEQWKIYLCAAIIELGSDGFRYGPPVYIHCRRHVPRDIRQNKPALMDQTD